MSGPLDVVFVDYQGPVVSAAWLNAVGSALRGTATTVVATEGQTVFTIPATSAGLVYISGLFQISGTNYTRTNSTTITFSEGLPEGAEVAVL